MEKRERGDLGRKPTKTTKCKRCGRDLHVRVNWPRSYAAKRWYICRECDTDRRREQRAKARLQRQRERYGHLIEALKASTGVRSGFLYVITNAAWPNALKVGRAIDPIDRLSTFQTGDPHRGYRLEYFHYYRDRYKAERIAHEQLGERFRALGGEWFEAPVDEAISVLKKIRV